jgi:predicted metalloprotease
VGDDKPWPPGLQSIYSAELSNHGKVFGYRCGMRVRGRVNTGQIEDRRGSRTGLAVGGGGIGIVGLVLALVFTLAGGGDGGSALDALRQLQPPGAATQDSEPLTCPDGAETSNACFVAAVVNDVQATWKDIFARQGRPYEETKLVLFSNATSTGCGNASSATGPFYCPADHKVYLDLGFFQELKDRFGAPGDFAQAYVIAHEFGHHVQNLLGAMKRAQRGGNEASIRLELQADCYAGIWAHETEVQPDVHDFDEALDAAAAVGDDRLQKQAGQQVNRETWTHGSSAQRMQWFRTGADSGDPAVCDTFSS